MQNLEQIRATSAIEAWKTFKDARGENGGDVVRSLSALIINNGLLATMSFAIDKKGGHLELMENICQYLTNKRSIFKAIFRPGDNKDDKVTPYLNALANAPSITLQQATDEALAYLTYLKRLRIKKA